MVQGKLEHYVRIMEEGDMGQRKKRPLANKGGIRLRCISKGRRVKSIMLAIVFLLYPTKFHSFEKILLHVQKTLLYSPIQKPKLRELLKT